MCRHEISLQVMGANLSKKLVQSFDVFRFLFCFEKKLQTTLNFKQNIGNILMDHLFCNNDANDI